MIIIRDKTGAYTELANRKKIYLSPILITDSVGKIVYDYRKSPILEISAAPGQLETLLEALGWKPGKDLVLPNPDIGSIAQPTLTFPAVKSVVSITEVNPDSYIIDIMGEAEKIRDDETRRHLIFSELSS